MNLENTSQPDHRLPPSVKPDEASPDLSSPATPVEVTLPSLSVAPRAKYETSGWDLSAVKISDVDAAMKSLEAQVAALETEQQSINENIPAARFMQILKQYEAIGAQSAKLGYEADLRTCSNTTDQDAQAIVARTHNFLAGLSNRLLFVTLGFKALSDEKASEIISQSGEYRYYLEGLRRYKPHTLSKAEEQVINIKDVNGVGALTELREIMTSKFSYDFDGKTGLTEGELSKYRYDPSPEKRAAMYAVLLEKYKFHQDELAKIYTSVVNDWNAECIGLRRYATPISVRNTANDISDKAIQALLNVCKQNQTLFHEFFEIKRQRLGLPTMTRSDIYAPLDTKPTNIDYDRAVNIILNAFNDFSPEFAASAKKIIEANHIDSEVRKNKRGGAFCSDVGTTVVPFVLLSYTGQLRDVSTLAHELGHGVHDLLAHCQTELTSHPALPVAETASIFSELLLSEKLKREAPEQAKELIFTKLEDIYASVIRQAGFVEFEIKAHEMIKNGSTADELSQVYLDDLKAQFGPGVEVPDHFRHEWLFIPHIVNTPFYCYAYSFGNLLTLGVYEKYKEQGAAFTPKILEMFAKGGSESPHEITKALGIDIESEAFWQSCFNVVREMVNELKK